MPVRAQKNSFQQVSQSLRLREPAPVPAYSTSLGQCWNIDALEGLKRLADDSVDLVVTSPPFALRRQKAYGNVDPSSYSDWLWPYVEQIHRVLHPTGSFVLELGGAHGGIVAIAQQPFHGRAIRFENPAVVGAGLLGFREPPN